MFAFVITSGLPSSTSSPRTSIEPQAGATTVDPAAFGAEIDGEMIGSRHGGSWGRSCAGQRPYVKAGDDALTSQPRV